MAKLEFDINKMAEGFAKAAKERGMFVGKWIPVETALPEDHKNVLICLSSDQIYIGCYNRHRLPFSDNVIGWGADHVHNWCSDDVVAWMPLPEPYKASPTGADKEGDAE